MAVVHTNDSIQTGEALLVFTPSEADHILAGVQRGRQDHVIDYLEIVRAPLSRALAHILRVIRVSRMWSALFAFRAPGREAWRTLVRALGNTRTRTHTRTRMRK